MKYVNYRKLRNTHIPMYNVRIPGSQSSRLHIRLLVLFVSGPGQSASVGQAFRLVCQSINQSHTTEPYVASELDRGGRGSRPPTVHVHK